MIEAFRSGGVIMWPLLIIAIGVVAMTIRAMIRRGPAPSEDARSRRDTVLFWGGVGALLGLLGTVVGLVQMAQNIQRAGSADAQLVWGGVANTLTSLVFGIIVLLLASVGWLLLQYRSGRTDAAA